MSQLYNFSAGPAVLPQEVLFTVQQELFDWHGSGISVMEMSHRSKAFGHIMAEAEEDCRTLLGVPKNYHILFLQGGAHTQFAMVPLNLLQNYGSADYIDTGHWSRVAISEAMRYGKVNIVSSAQAEKDTTIPAEATWQRDRQAAYLHYTSNETIGGVQFPFIPQSDVPLVADMSSDFMSRPLEVNRFGLIYASAQKNIGPAGLTLVIIREDLLGHAVANTPTMLNYKTFADTNSLYNTPPAFAIYVAGLMFKWLKRQGGLRTMATLNHAKSRLLYEVIDQSEGFYQGLVAQPYRSQMNVTFHLPTPALESTFLAEADSHQLLHLRGHRAAGGIRASIYNAMPLEGVKVLADFMRDFIKHHG
jgi:phosphoserine aminotransferase